MHIKSYISKTLLLLCFLFPFNEIKAQGFLQDSLALVALYNAQPLMGDSTWLQGNVSTWTGVTVYGNRVAQFELYNKGIYAPIPAEICGLDSLTFISMSFNNFTGLIPACIIDMPHLSYLGLSYNQLTGVEVAADFSHMNNIFYIGIASNHFTDMPDLVSIPSPFFQALNVEYNGFDFNDLLPILGTTVTNFAYSPQQRVGVYQRMDVSVGDTVIFADVSGVAGGTGNSYNWLIEEGLNTYTPPAVRFKNTNTSSMHAEGVQLSDTRVYHCEITVPNLPGLTLTTNQFDLRVTDPLLSQTVTYLGDTLTHCRDSLLVLTALASSGNPVSFVSLNNDIASVNLDNTLNIYQSGTVTIRATTPADAFYHADTLLIHVTVASDVILPALQIVQQLPRGEGGDLGLSVEYFPALTYQWTTPNGQLYDSSSLIVSPLTSSDLGIYTVRLKEGSCLRNVLSVAVNDLVYGEIIIYELITPNGDGDNETFYIKNLNPALHNEVSIFNTSHQVVFHEENYRNNWGGDHLPVGTYYYIVRVEENTYKGNLYIKR